jgi:hypothetical protein
MKAKEERLCVDCDGDTCTPKKRASKPKTKTSKKVEKLSNPTIAPLAELDRWKKAHALLWLRLSWARGALYQLKPTKEREAVLRETQTNDAPSYEMIDWAKAHVLKEQERRKGKRRTT